MSGTEISISISQRGAKSIQRQGQTSHCSLHSYCYAHPERCLCEPWRCHVPLSAIAPTLNWLQKHASGVSMSENAHDLLVESCEKSLGSDTRTIRRGAGVRRLGRLIHCTGPADYRPQSRSLLPPSRMFPFKHLTSPLKTGGLLPRKARAFLRSHASPDSDLAAPTND